MDRKIRKGRCGWGVEEKLPVAGRGFGPCTLSGFWSLSVQGGTSSDGSGLEKGPGQRIEPETSNVEPETSKGLVLDERR